MSVRAVLLLIFVIGSGQIWAAETPAGESSLKIEDLDSGLTTGDIRKELEDVSREIEELDREITEARSQALSYRAANIGGTSTSSLEALARAHEMERDGLIEKRSQLQDELLSE